MKLQKPCYCSWSEQTGSTITKCLQSLTDLLSNSVLAFMAEGDTESSMMT